MAYRPKPAGPKSIRALFHYLWRELTAIGVEIESGGGGPGGAHDDLTGVTPDQHHPQLHSIGTHSDVITTSLAANELLAYNGASYVNDRRTKVFFQTTQPTDAESLEGDFWFKEGW